MILALDVGGSKIAIGSVSNNGQANTLEIVPTPKKKELVLRAIIDSIKRHRSHDTKVVGIGIAGQIDSAHGVVRSSPNLNLTNVPLAALVKKTTKLRAVIENDARCFALGEAARGAGRGKKSVFGVTLGTGIGGGFIVDGKIFSGHTGTAGEIGHLVVDLDPRAPRCSCGLRGHLEAYAGGRAMLARARTLGSSATNSSALEARYRGNERVARTVVTEASAALAVGFANILTVWNPDCIVVGGGLAKFATLWKAALPTMRARVPFPLLVKTPVVTACLGSNAALIGAALLTQK